jgi:hypothetical protein
MCFKKISAMICCLSVVLALVCGCDDFFSITTITTSAPTSPQETSSTMIGASVSEVLQIVPESVESLEIVQMGDGQSVVIEDKEQINKILRRLSDIKFTKDLGTTGYTPTGFSLRFTVKANAETTLVKIQIDAAESAYCATFHHHFYEISDESKDENLNKYFENEKYK